MSFSFSSKQIIIVNKMYFYIIFALQATQMFTYIYKATIYTNVLIVHIQKGSNLNLNNYYIFEKPLVSINAASVATCVTTSL